ncbi:Trk1p [Malassezia vespertilionis]|uniref:Potassium transport protein n=1 Tax=Malassezia vespertilionis TaxID=2020962 RepID=A0A2N1JH73_9BASI|nr:Trk1p [Malassezia vespertilionis]
MDDEAVDGSASGDDPWIVVLWRTFVQKCRAFALTYLNYFRVHLLYFTVVILIASGIFYGSSSKGNHIDYVDCLFLTTSAMTVTGLVTLPISQTSLGQQIILFILMVIGNLVLNSLVIVLLRRHFFSRKFRSLMAQNASARQHMLDVEQQVQREHHQDMEKVLRFFGKHEEDILPSEPKPKPGKNKKKKLTVGMVHRIDEPARQVNPTGHMTTMVADRVTDEAPVHETSAHTPQGTQGTAALHGILHNTETTDEYGVPVHSSREQRGVRIEEPNARSIAFEHGPSVRIDAPNDTTLARRLSDSAPRRRNLTFSRAQTMANVESEPQSCTASPLRDDDREMVRSQTMSALPLRARTLSFAMTDPEKEQALPDPRLALHRTMTKNMNKGLGGFPTPIELVLGLMEMVHVRRKLRVARTTTMASTNLSRMHAVETFDGEYVKPAPYLTFDARVSGNSHFHNLSAAQRQELGGVEYRALDVLAWLIPCYWLFWVALCLLIGTPYMASKSAQRFRDQIEGQERPPRSSSWFWVFNTVSAMTNLGMSLSDSSMAAGFQNAYLLLIPMMVLILVGNTAYPVMLRFVIWIASKLTRKASRTYETLQFLLDHPRRCFVYLFPRENTWFLFALLVAVNIGDWFFIMILDLSERKKAFSTGAWVLDALFQSIATRSAGFQTLDILSLSPAEQMLQVFLMYLAVFPLTMAVRSTNVYEEGSLGIYEPKTDAGSQTRGSDGDAVWGRFLSEQMRRQVAYDLWWIALAIWIVCIAEKSKLQDNETYPYISIFTVIYELVSAYGTVGISTGSPPRSASLSADFTVVSKLVVCAVMLRGRHRGLPGAIDRAILLPSEISAYDQTHDSLHRELDPVFTNAEAIVPLREAPLPSATAPMPDKRDAKDAPTGPHPHFCTSPEPTSPTLGPHPPSIHSL